MFTEQTQAIVNTLNRLALHNCGMRHEHAWKSPNLIEPPQCDKTLAEVRIGCAHSENLAIKAAIKHIYDLKIIPYEDYETLFTLVRTVEFNLSVTDVAAQEASPLVVKQMLGKLNQYDLQRIESQRKDILQGQAFTGLNLDSAFKAEQKELSIPLTELKQVLLDCFDQLKSGLELNLTALTEYIQKARLYVKCVHNFEAAIWSAGSVNNSATCL